MDLRDGIDKEEAEQINQAGKAYARYGAIGLQMALFIGLCTWGGTALDDSTGWRFPLFTLLGVFIGLVGGMWYLLKETKRKP